MYPDRRTRADALGVWAAVSGLALALGPVIAGVLVGVASWRAIFWSNLGFGVLAFAMAAAFVPESSDREGRSFDLPGTVLGAVALACLSFAIIQGESSGYLTWWIVLLFVAAGVLGAAFVVVEQRRRYPMLALRYFRRPPFLGSNVVAFVAYVGTFSIFFFTALYLQVVVAESAFRTAVDFLPMAAGLILASVVTGPWVARAGPRVPMVAVCVLAAAGVLATSAVLGPHVGIAELGWTLPLAGVGFGIALVPVTSAALTVVPPERSGMAASTTNTSRELGAVLGVAVLGSIVNSKLTGQLAARLGAIGIPPSFQSLVLHAVTGGGLGSSGSATHAEHSKNAEIARIATKVVHAAYDAFGAGLHEALEISGALLLLGAVTAALTVHRSHQGETYEL